MEKITGKRQQRTQENRKLILDTAQELFNHAGYDQTTMSDIQKASGLSNGTIYHLFKSKQAILEGIYEQYFRPDIGLCENLEEKIKEPLPYIVDFLNSFERQWMAAGSAVSTNIYLIFQGDEFADEKKDKGIHSETYSLYGPTAQKELRNFLTEVDRIGGLRDDVTPESALDCIFIFGRGLLFSWSLTKGSYDLVEWAKPLWKTFLPSFFRTE
ncbi:MAG: TetR/AcrR family transcriptional regulator [Lachnospiraceae bacterium]|nr:TetR/AcrR family transcriptional regulator [Lachnospiraceae bacterium]